MTAELQRKISKAKAALIIENPFIASLVCSMPITLDAGLAMPTLATNGEWIKAHPNWIADHTVAQIKWALAHETLHCVFQHFLKEGTKRNHAKWNIAGDVIINVMLSKEPLGKERPSGVIWDASPILGGRTAVDLYAAGKTTVGVYNLLPDPPEDGGAGGGGGGAWDDCEELTGDPSRAAEASARMQVKVAQAAAAAKMCGKLSAEMERFVGEVLQPKVDWAKQLRDFFNKRAKVEYSYARPNRRFMHQGLYLASKSGHTLGTILLAFDQSGSVSPAEISAFTSEMQAIKEDCQPEEVHVLYFASTVMKHDKFERDEELLVKPNGTGGTAFSPIFKYALDHGIEPAACVVLTDLCCNDFGPQPDYPVMWCSTAAGKAPWGEVIMLEDVGG